MSRLWRAIVTKQLVERAAHNNALWCEAVCAVHDTCGEFHRDFWLNRMEIDRLYPNLVTLSGSEGVSAQKKAVAELIRARRRDGWSVKDSFQNLDLDDLGFSPLFEAQWLSLAEARGGDGRDVDDVQWTTIGDGHGLDSWELAWRKANAEVGSALLFKPELLDRNDIRFVMAISNGVCVGGGVLNAGAGVVGLTNLFAGGSIWTRSGRAWRASPERLFLANRLSPTIVANRLSRLSASVLRRSGALAFGGAGDERFQTQSMHAWRWSMVVLLDIQRLISHMRSNC